MLAKGVTTEAEFFTSLKKRNQIAHHADAWRELFGMKLSPEDQSLVLAYESPPMNTPEVPAVQNFMSELLQKLLENSPFYWTDPESYRHPSFGTRKPDHVIYKKGSSGPLAIVLFCETKGRCRDNKFTAEHCGHCLDMARELMEDYQPRRNIMFCCLSDGERFQFFCLYRHEHDDLQYDMSEVYLGRNGLQVRPLLWPVTNHYHP